MKKAICLLMATILLIPSAFIFVSCGSITNNPTKYQSVPLTDENIENYITIKLSYENFKCKKKYNNILGIVEYDWSANCKIEIKSQNSSCKYDSVNMNVKVITFLSSNNNLNISLDENGNYESYFYCYGTEYSHEPNINSGYAGVALVTNVGGTIRIPEG